MILHAEQAGDGTPVALLHGLFGQGRNLGVAARALAATHRVISLDLRNHGASPHAAGMEYRVLASDVLETLDALGALPASLLGHSMGGKTAMAAALLRPDAVTRLLVADIAPVAYAGHGNAAIVAALRNVKLGAATTRADVMAALQDVVPDAQVRAFLAQNFVPGAAPRWRIGLAEIAAAIGDLEGWPDFTGAVYGGVVLFVAGGASDYVQPAYFDMMRALFPAYRLTVLDGAGHWLHAQQPAAFAAAAAGFLGS